MNRKFVLDPKNRKRALIALIVCVMMLTAAVILASRTQRDFGRVTVADTYYPNANTPMPTAFLSGLSSLYRMGRVGKILCRESCISTDTRTIGRRETPMLSK